MFYSLRFRLFLALLLVAILAVALVAVLAGAGTLDQFTRYVNFQNQQDQQVIATVIEHQIRSGGLQSIDPLAGILEDAYDQEITLTGPGGDVLYSTAGGVEIVEERVIVEDTEFVTPTVGSDVSKNQVALLDFEGPGTITTTTRTISSNNGSEQSFFGSVNRIFIITAVIAILLAGLLSLLLARRIIKPIKELTQAAAQLEAGDLSRRVSVGGSDELAQLATAFNAMAGSLERQETLRRHMVTDIAHELRTPLANLYGYLEAIEDGFINPDPTAIQSLMEETHLLNQLVEDLQEISLFEAGELRLEIQPIALEPVILTTLEALRPIAQTKSIALQVDIADDLPQVAADPRRLAQILRNLLNNSLTHTAENGRITLSATCNPPPAGMDFILIQIHDNGPGIEPEHQPHIFDRFYRADAARARTTGGSGLGLAISKMLVEVQGGEIWLKSVVGEGTAVSFTLPIYP